MLAVLSIVILELTGSNGANGVAMGDRYAGSGAAHARRAIAWGIVRTTLGSFLARSF